MLLSLVPVRDLTYWVPIMFDPGDTDHAVA